MFSHSAQTLRSVYCVVHSKPLYGRKKVKRTWCLGNLTLSLSHANNSTNTQSLISSLFTMLQDKDWGNGLKYCVYSGQGNQFEAQLKRPSDARARLLQPCHRQICQSCAHPSSSHGTAHTATTTSGGPRLFSRHRVSMTLQIGKIIFVRLLYNTLHGIILSSAD